MSEQKPKDKKKKWNNRGFYVALSVGVLAVAAAAWTTYDSIAVRTEDPTTQELPTSAVITQQEKPVEQKVSGVTIESSSASSAVSSRSSAASSAASRPAAVTSGSSAQTTQNTASSSPVSSAVSSAPETQETAASPTEFLRPAGQEVTKRYSGENLVYSETMQDWRAHQGTDFAAETGSPVIAAADGTVKEIRQDSSLGIVVVIAHGDTEISYCGMEEDLSVEEGDAVTAGQTIGSVGTVPFEMNEDPHLHVEVKRDGEWLDPAAVLTE